ncbi:MAG: hypothetical protein MRY49_00245 [Candidatus Pacebacteria bacterium]|nr:hypothetical protein [Candidatus Paceibacterota bacterium]
MIILFFILAGLAIVVCILSIVFPVPTPIDYLRVFNRGEFLPACEVYRRMPKSIYKKLTVGEVEEALTRLMRQGLLAYTVSKEGEFLFSNPRAPL